jgi:hypothetical protein
MEAIVRRKRQRFLEAHSLAKGQSERQMRQLVTPQNRAHSIPPPAIQSTEARNLDGRDPQSADTSVFDRYLSRAAALVRHKSTPMVKERAQFLLSLEATGTRRSAIRIASTYLLQVVNLLGLQQLRDVTLEEVDEAADRWSTLRNKDKEYPFGQAGVRCFAQTARRLATTTAHTSTMVVTIRMFP